MYLHILYLYSRNTNSFLMSEKATRIIKLYARLKRGPVTIEMIRSWADAHDIKISTRTLYRDLDTLEAHLAVRGEKLVVIEGEKNRKTWKIEFEKSAHELNAFDLTSYHLFKQFAPLSIVEARKSSLEKLEERFYTANSKSEFEQQTFTENDQISSTHFYEYAFGAEYQQVLEDVIWSIQNKREISIESIRFDNTSLSASISFPAQIRPLQILYHRGCVHVLGYIDKQQRAIALALEQIVSYKLSNSMFDRNKTLVPFQEQMLKRFGVTDNIDQKTYAISIEFASTTGDFVTNHQWHPTQRFEKKKNGNYIMHLQCGINRELIGWIFQWMNNARVLRPAKLKSLVLATINDTKKNYSTTKPLVYSNKFREE